MSMVSNVVKRKIAIVTLIKKYITNIDIIIDNTKVIICNNANGFSIIMIVQTIMTIVNVSNANALTIEDSLDLLLFWFDISFFIIIFILFLYMLFIK